MRSSDSGSERMLRSTACSVGSFPRMPISFLQGGNVLRAQIHSSICCSASFFDTIMPAAADHWRSVAASDRAYDGLFDSKLGLD